MIKKCCELLKPAIHKKYLLFVAGFVWTIAGIILCYRGLYTANPLNSQWHWQIPLVIAGGLLFYIFVFTRISDKHITRILNIEKEIVCLFSFFNGRSYLMMLVMITGGVLLRRSHLVGNESLGLFLVVMAIPLLGSAIKFYTAGIKNLRDYKKK